MNNKFHIQLNWKREKDFTYELYNRNHTLTFDGGQVLQNSAAAEYLGEAHLSNPEELLAGALMSCHMMSFLAVASKTGYVIESYTDQAEAILEKNADGKLAITTINLKPIIEFSGNKNPDDEAKKILHEKAHKICFIANSIKTKVNIL
jgi:organic hydroperoxide reductase OsmC/OhrA